MVLFPPGGPLSRWFILPIAAVVGAIGASSAHAAGSTLVTVGTGSGPGSRSVQVNISSTGGAPLDVKVTGAADGVLTITDPSGIDFLSVTGAPCEALNPTAVKCGAVGDPVTYLMVWGGNAADTIDLSGLAAQATSKKGFQAGANAFDVDLRMGQIFAYVKAGASADTITGGGANAAYEPGAGADTVSGGAGDEIVRAEETPDGDDTVTGGGGFDTVSYSRRTAGVRATLSDTTTNGSGDNSTSESDSLAGFEAITGGSGGDTLSIIGTLANVGTLLGSGGDDTLTGGPGSDKLLGGDGADELRGEAGDDQLTDSRKSGEAQGHLHGGAGDDELVQRLMGDSWSGRAADGAPTCGEGNDVLRADPGFDEGVSTASGPADCEFLANSYGTPGSIAGEKRVGMTVTALPPADLSGTPITGRVVRVKWTLCSPAALGCDERETAVPELTLVPADAGKIVHAAAVYLSEPFSASPRWVEERQYPVGTGLVVANDTEVVQGGPPTLLPPPVVAKPNAATIANSLTAAFGKKPRLSLLKKTATLKFPAPAATAITVSLTAKQGKKKRKVLATGSATAGKDDTVALKLGPTAAGRKAARGKKAVSVSVEVSATNAGGKTTAASKLKLKTQ